MTDLNTAPSSKAADHPVHPRQIAPNRLCEKPISKRGFPPSDLVATGDEQVNKERAIAALIVAFFAASSLDLLI